MDARPIALLLFAFTFWLGGYLIARNPAKPAMQLAGWGLMAYALAMVLYALAMVFESEALTQVQRIVGILPAVLWALALVFLFHHGSERNSDVSPRRPLGLLFVGALFFALSMALFLVNLFPPFWALTLIGVDLGLLGLALARLDAFDEGESFSRDAVRSLVGSGLMALLFGGAVLIAANANGGLTGPMLALTFVVIALAIDAQLFAPRLQTWLDRLILPARVQRQRAELRETSEALARADALNPLTLDEAEFARLTRRALSHMTDLPKLAASPLTRLPVVDRHLAARGMPDSPLDRAAALKAVLTHHIGKLKPADDGGSGFGTSDAWRHYNALHFPYVIGLKPYSTRTAMNGHDGLAPVDEAALKWFQSSVPERTLHNWQNAAAKVIAEELQASSPVGLEPRMGLRGSG